MGQGASKVATTAVQRASRAPAATPRPVAPPTAVYPEMPPEMIKFLQDVGPLRKPDDDNTPVKAAIKKKPPRNWNEGAFASDPKRGSDPTRRVEPMPLAENIPGFDTNRTTNFSYKEEVLQDGQLVIEDFYRLLARPDQLLFPESPKELLQQSYHFLHLPVILRDTDDTLVGAFPDRVDDLVRTKLVPTEITQVKLVLQDLVERQEEESSTLEVKQSKVAAK
jgi:hypothetical protein